jgi:hydroxymethylpyrimidine pyrophosphatase-like HAD family hydrolase
MSLRCVYTDLDGTLLGPGASLFRDGDGGFTLLAARALEACHRAGVEVVLKSGRRRAQVAEDARLIGQGSYIFELGGGLVIDGEVTWLADRMHDEIAETGEPERLVRDYDLEHHSPWHTGREVSHLFRGSVDVAAVNEQLEGLRLVDNGGIDDGRRVYHLVPAETSKARAVDAHMRARGYAREDCIAVGDSREDAEVAPLVREFFMVANGDPIEGVTVTEASFGEGFYEAVVGSLMDR